MHHLIFFVVTIDLVDLVLLRYHQFDQDLRNLQFVISEIRKKILKLKNIKTNNRHINNFITLLTLLDLQLITEKFPRPTKNENI